MAGLNKWRGWEAAQRWASAEGSFQPFWWEENERADGLKRAHSPVTLLKLGSCGGNYMSIMQNICFTSPQSKLFRQTVFARHCQIINMLLLRNATNIFMWSIYLNILCLRIIFWKRKKCLYQKKTTGKVNKSLLK